ncbi:metal-sensing transcriptional repressor [Pannonibacter phragmitetus]|uniref:metal-sensing transcriptional repressor n=1 Tax=Pannonibacter phragmitetus TaxID=121719 RepID=UPI000B95DB08|nr:metal-sensing transcriptional repressor [Pannonibacter phragmitetus]
MTHANLHASHPDIVKRLKRAEGHLKSIIAMIEAGRPCLDIAQQMHAVEKAVQQAKRTLIHDHLDHCLGTPSDRETGPDRQFVDNLKALAKYL